MDIIVIVMMLVIGAVAAAMEGDFSGVKVIWILSYGILAASGKV